ncbi:MAG: GntR family transcriptional regulator [Bacilli bacterium]|nr:GntR family transcriptional regulator [Bacilli bacterium]
MRYEDESLPLYVRIAEGAKEYLLRGMFQEEVKLPSTTELAKQYKINIATVNKAIAILVNEGYVYKKRGIGMFVKKGALNKLIKERRKEFKEKYVYATLYEAKKLNYTIDELIDIARESYKEIYGEPTDKI